MKEVDTMNTTKKITKKMKYTELSAFLSTLPADTKFGADLTADDMVAFIDHEVELLDNKNAVKGEKKPTEKQKQNAKIGEDVVSFMSPNTLYTVSELLKKVPNLPEDMSLPRMTHIVTALVADNKLVRTVDKRKAYFSLA